MSKTVGMGSTSPKSMESEIAKENEELQKENAELREENKKLQEAIVGQPQAAGKKKE